MGRLYFIAGAAGVFLAMATALWWQTNRLGEAQAKAGQLEERVGMCTDANAQSQATIDDLLTRIEALVAERRRHEERMATAVADARASANEATADRDRALQELEALYEGDCEAWSRVPVCPGVADRVRR